MDVFIPGGNLTEENSLDIAVRRTTGAHHPDFASKVAEFLSGSR